MNETNGETKRLAELEVRTPPHFLEPKDIALLHTQRGYNIVNTSYRRYKSEDGIVVGYLCTMRNSKGTEIHFLSEIPYPLNKIQCGTECVCKKS